MKPFRSLLTSLVYSLLASVFLFSATTTKSLAIEPIVIKKVVDFQADKNLIINSESVFNLPPNVIEAIHHEIPLNFKIHIELLEDNHWLGFNLPRVRNSIEFHTILRAYGVARKYTLFNTRNQNIQTFQRLEDALQTLATLESFPVASLSELHPEQRYTLRMRIHLDYWKLKAPLLMEALFSDEWKIDSGWYETTLQTPLSWQ